MRAPISQKRHQEPLSKVWRNDWLGKITDTDPVDDAIQHEIHVVQDERSVDRHLDAPAGILKHPRLNRAIPSSTQAYAVMGVEILRLNGMRATSEIGRGSNGHDAEFIENTYRDHIFGNPFANANAGVKAGANDVGVRIVGGDFELYLRELTQEPR
jgi:hypothetical protein